MLVQIDSYACLLCVLIRGCICVADQGVQNYTSERRSFGLGANHLELLPARFADSVGSADRTMRLGMRSCCM